MYLASSRMNETGFLYNFFFFLPKSFLKGYNYFVMDVIGSKRVCSNKNKIQIQTISLAINPYTENFTDCYDNPNGN
jgi:hypothetical protein